MYFSPSTKWFYDVLVNGDDMPVDVVEITAEERAALSAAESSGKVIQTGDEGKPVALDPAPPTPEQLRDAIKQQISELEIANLMPRATREFMLLFMESQGKPEQLAKNIGYVKVKAFDQEIAALRKSL